MNKNIISLLSFIELNYQNAINNVIEQKLRPIIEKIDKEFYKDNVTISKIINYYSKKSITICVVLQKNEKKYQNYNLQLTSNGLAYQDDNHRRKNNDLNKENYFNNIYIELINSSNIHVYISGYQAIINLGKINITYDLIKQEIIQVKPNIISHDSGIKLLKDTLIIDGKVIYEEHYQEQVLSKKIYEATTSDEKVRYKLNYRHPNVHQIEPGIAKIELGEATVIYDNINRRIKQIIPNIVSEESCFIEMIKKSMIKVRYYHEENEEKINYQEYKRRRVR